ncbi:MAG: hypothetical protein Q8O55_03945 [Dehalococcoidales bacterium]|nr:hypothetical protein [Dehalococcoidales bacterium]
MVIKGTKTDLQGKLKSILQYHEGPAQAITASELARMCGTSDRSIRLAIRELIRGNGDGHNGLPVASSTENPPGYFIPTRRSQGEQYAASIRSRLIEDALRRRDYRRAADEWFTPAEQGRLTL